MLIYCPTHEKPEIYGPAQIAAVSIDGLRSLILVGAILGRLFGQDCIASDLPPSLGDKVGDVITFPFMWLLDLHTEYPSDQPGKWETVEASQKRSTHLPPGNETWIKSKQIPLPRGLRRRVIYEHQDQ